MFIQQLWMLHIWSLNWPLDILSPFQLLWRLLVSTSSSYGARSLFFFSTRSWGKYLALWLLNASLRLLLVTNCVCLLFAAEQVLYGGCFELFQQKQLPAVVENNTMRVNQNGKVAGWTDEQWAKTHFKAPFSWGGLQSQVIIVCRFITVGDPFHLITLFSCCHLIDCCKNSGCSLNTCLYLLYLTIYLLTIYGL